MPKIHLLFLCTGNACRSRMAEVGPAISAVKTSKRNQRMLVIYAMGLLRALLSPERVRDYVRGRPKWLARTLAVTLGAVTPFCSRSSVPLFSGFVEAHVDPRCGDR